MGNTHQQTGPLLTNSPHPSILLHTPTRTKTLNLKRNNPNQKYIQIPFHVDDPWVTELLINMPWAKEQFSAAWYLCYTFLRHTWYMIRGPECTECWVIVTLLVNDAVSTKISTSTTLLDIIRRLSLLDTFLTYLTIKTQQNSKHKRLGYIGKATT